MAGITTMTTGMSGLAFRNMINGNFAIPPKVFNVVDYGAVHNGVTDDTEAIQTAINACDAAGGGTVFFPAGEYIIAGALQNNIGDDSVDPNSQIYIPHYKYTALTVRHSIKLLGEKRFPHNITASVGGMFDPSTQAVILRSTIAGSGTWPSVIGSQGTVEAWGPMNYNDAIIENIAIQVPNTEDGPTMNGINFMYQAWSYLNDVWVGIAPSELPSVIPAANVFGIAVGKFNGDGAIIGRIYSSGFTYGVILGEIVHADYISTGNCYIGLMCIKNTYGNSIKSFISFYNAYDIASQQETFYDDTPGRSTIVIDNMFIETIATVWNAHVDLILDTDNRLFGSGGHYLGGELNLTDYITKTNGGLNFLLKNVYTASAFYWTTATRPPLLALSFGTVGWNFTTSKLEVFDGTNWIDLH